MKRNLCLPAFQLNSACAAKIGAFTKALLCALAQEISCANKTDRIEEAQGYNAKTSTDASSKIVKHVDPILGFKEAMSSV